VQRSFLLALVATCWTRPQSVRYPANFYASSSSIETWLERDSIRANRARQECRDTKNNNNELMTAH